MRAIKYKGQPIECKPGVVIYADTRFLDWQSAYILASGARCAARDAALADGIPRIVVSLGESLCYRGGLFEP